VLGNRGTRTRSELCYTHPSADQESSPLSIDHKSDFQHIAPPRGTVFDVNVALLHVNGPSRLLIALLLNRNVNFVNMTSFIDANVLSLCDGICLELQ